MNATIRAAAKRLQSRNFGDEINADIEAVARFSLAMTDETKATSREINDTPAAYDENDHELLNEPTRGQLNALRLALGIALKEPAT